MCGFDLNFLVIIFFFLDCFNYRLIYDIELDICVVLILVFCVFE